MFIHLSVPLSLSQSSRQSQEITNLQDTVAVLKEDFQKSMNATSTSQKDLQDTLVAAKHDLLRVQEQLALAEKVRTPLQALLHVLGMPFDTTHANMFQRPTIAFI